MRLGLIGRLTLVEGVRQIVQRDRRFQAEKSHRLAEQVRFDGLAMLHQRIGGPVQLHRPHGLEVHPQQLAQGATLA